MKNSLIKLEKEIKIVCSENRERKKNISTKIEQVNATLNKKIEKE